MNRITKTSSGDSDELDARAARTYSRLAILSACVVVVALILMAVARKLHCAMPNMEALEEIAIAAGIVRELVFHHLAGKASERSLRRSEARVRRL